MSRFVPLAVTVALIVAAVVILLVVSDEDRAPISFVELEVENWRQWEWCVYQEAFSSEPSLFIDGSLFTVIRAESEWQRLLVHAITRGEESPGSHCDEVGPAPSLDADFSNEMVIVLVRGASSGGYSLSLDGVVMGDNDWTVEATWRKPGNCGVTDAIEYHDVFIRAPRSLSPVRLELSEQTSVCES